MQDENRMLSGLTRLQGRVVGQHIINYFYRQRSSREWKTLFY